LRGSEGCIQCDKNCSRDTKVCFRHLSNRAGDTYGCVCHRLCNCLCFTNLRLLLLNGDLLRFDCSFGFFLLDLFGSWVVGIVVIIPPLPDEVATALDWMADGGAALSAAVANFNPIIPWDLLASIISLWLGVMAFWGLTVAIRVLLRLLGR